nr:hypothetical protein [Clostridia bacterium]
MKKKSLFIVFSLILIIVCMLVFVACDKTNVENNNQPSSEWGAVYTMDAAYARAAELGYAGTLEEFITMIS